MTLVLCVYRQVHLLQQVGAPAAAATRSNRFAFTPKHGSWLNLIEAFFGKLAKYGLDSLAVA